jgi:uncharacterized protein YndB with AHSA1/START domain
MGTTNLIARSSTIIDAPPGTVWKALVSPEAIREYMFGATVVTDWQEGHSIVWKGEWKGKRYEDRGVLLHVTPDRALQYTHFSPLGGLPDLPENYHTVTIELNPEGQGTLVSLSQDNNTTAEACEESAKNWASMLAGLKRYLEQTT